MQIFDEDVSYEDVKDNLGPLDSWILSKLNKTIKEVTKTVIPDYTFPEKPEFPMDIEKLPDGRYAINGEYFKSLDAYFVLIDALEEEYNIDKELYNKGEINE